MTDRKTAQRLYGTDEPMSTRAPAAGALAVDVEDGVTRSISSRGTEAVGTCATAFIDLDSVPT